MGLYPNNFKLSYVNDGSEYIPPKKPKDSLPGWAIGLIIAFCIIIAGAIGTYLFFYFKKKK